MTANALQFSVAQPTPQDAPPPAYEKYPMVMVHPNARKATMVGTPGTEKRNPLTGEIIPGEFFGWTGTSDFMPPVTVMNQDQEAMHYAQGYRPGGQGDIAAFSNLTAGASIKPHVVEEWPKWVNGILCANAQEEAAASGETTAPVGGAVGEQQAEPTPKPRHVASPHVKRGRASKGRTWSPERRAAYEASKAAP